MSFELAATSEGYMTHGERIAFEEVEPLDFCVVGSVAVTRSGRPHGQGRRLADLETGIFRELGLIGPETPMATTIHSSQLVAESVSSCRHTNSPLDLIATESELIVTGNGAPRPKGVDWHAVQPDQFETIPFLTALRDRMTQ